MSDIDVLNKIIEWENKALEAEFIAPVACPGCVFATVDGIKMRYTIDSDFTGWGVFKSLPGCRARYLRDADPWEIEEYASRLENVDFILTEMKNADIWQAFSFNKGRFALIHLVRGAQRFDRVTACLERGAWFFVKTANHNAGKKNAVQQILEPEETPVEDFNNEPAPNDAAFAVVRTNQHEARLKNALALGGAVLLSYVQNAWGYTVQWQKNGRIFDSMVDRDLNVISAGFCMDGADRTHDLASLASLVER